MIRRLCKLVGARIAYHLLNRVSPHWRGREQSSTPESRPCIHEPTQAKNGSSVDCFCGTHGWIISTARAVRV